MPGLDEAYAAKVGALIRWVLFRKLPARHAAGLQLFSTADTRTVTDGAAAYTSQPAQGVIRTPVNKAACIVHEQGNAGEQEACLSK